MGTILLPNISFDKKLTGLTTPGETPVNPSFFQKEFPGNAGAVKPTGDLPWTFTAADKCRSNYLILFLADKLAVKETLKDSSIAG
jgi:hypothetical protein